MYIRLIHIREIYRFAHRLSRDQLNTWRSLVIPEAEKLAAVNQVTKVWRNLPVLGRSKKTKQNKTNKQTKKKKKKNTWRWYQKLRSLHAV